MQAHWDEKPEIPPPPPPRTFPIAVLQNIYIIWLKIAYIYYIYC